MDVSTCSISLPDVSLRVACAGQGRPLLLVHGFPLDHAMWRGQLAGLAADFDVIAPDPRGFGSSAVTPGKVTMDGFARDLAALLDALDVADEVVLCGLSMGGYIAFQFARLFPERLAGLVLCDTRAAPDTPEAAAARLQNADKVERSGPEELVTGMLPKLFSPLTQAQEPALVEATRQIMLKTDRRGIAAALRGMAERPDARPMLSSIRVPTLVLAGHDDAISPPSEMRTFAEQIPCARFVEIPRAGHMAPLEQPEAVNATIRTLARARAPGAT
ncbi:MAG: alpha/beta fold hydrolase [Planctomycetia bacterium]|nr:alpha/beta fold hydrolase [Planctomycetia bacterium]